ncbi:amidohydrolase family protein [Sphingomonas sp. BT-65]|uniref:amidohydrolase family protein n=1 Tax=Sphingomonas sp. BT-65 TaxID=2989821 RepID=UPI0022366971|nr:amidohydrolase family protein [Sphingomonas sp. BT-65]MCW4463857.1 amidohydrolase family protein [Sphingomonas sp. BT-65]
MLLIAAAFVALRGTASDAKETGQSIAFVGVNVVPMDRERVLANQTVVVRGGRIVSMAPASTASIPAGARRIEGKGRWLMPGLAEMHGHVPGPEEPAYRDDMLFLYLANGVTTVRNMAGNASHLALRDRIAAGELLGPTLYTASPWLSAAAAGTPDKARQAVRDYRAAGYDLIKIGSVPRDAYLAMADAANAIKMPFGGHIPEEVRLTDALASRQTSIDHLDRYVEFLVPEGTDTAGRPSGFFGSGWVQFADARRIPDAVRRTITAGTWNVPTLSLVEHLASSETPEAMIAWPEMRYMPKRLLDGWAKAKREFAARPDFQPDAARWLVELRRRLLRELHAAGAPIALGSDAPQFFNVPGFSIHHEMRMMQAAGLSPYQVLATGTREAARYFGPDARFGTIAPGQRADLILLTANPLEQLANVERRAGVMVRGRWLPESEIQARLEKIAAAARTN